VRKNEKQFAFLLARYVVPHLYLAHLNMQTHQVKTAVEDVFSEKEKEISKLHSWKNSHPLLLPKPYLNNYAPS